jgi:hypothetical protein
MKRTIEFVAAWLLLVAAACNARAQTISPVIQEYQQKADSRFQVYNDADVLLTVTLEPFSFSVDSKGTATFRKLDPGIHVQLSATSFRVQPKQTYYVFYKATAENLPGWFCIYATFTGASTANGLKLAFKLPHTVYLLDKTPLERSQVQWVRAQTSADSDKQRITAEVENTSPGFGRVRQIEVTTALGKQAFPGFPLFPGQRRLIELDWSGPGTPQNIVLTFDRFKTETGLQTISAQSQP